ncbi:MAG: hypothetical protein IT410_03410 [Candidatus Doudnabacteria bacterium]|nr:hypothetical protein [Candidatus Doudnabacteria bacterium]
MRFNIGSAFRRGRRGGSEAPQPSTGPEVEEPSVPEQPEAEPVEAENEVNPQPAEVDSVTAPENTEPAPENVEPVSEVNPDEAAEEIAEEIAPEVAQDLASTPIEEVRRNIAAAGNAEITVEQAQQVVDTVATPEGENELKVAIQSQVKKRWSSIASVAGGMLIGGGTRMAVKAGLITVFGPAIWTALGAGAAAGAIVEGGRRIYKEKNKFNRQEMVDQLRAETDNTKKAALINKIQELYNDARVSGDAEAVQQLAEMASQAKTDLTAAVRAPEFENEPEKKKVLFILNEAKFNREEFPKDQRKEARDLLKQIEFSVEKSNINWKTVLTRGILKGALMGSIGAAAGYSLVQLGGFLTEQTGLGSGLQHIKENLGKLGAGSKPGEIKGSLAELAAKLHEEVGSGPSYDGQAEQLSADLPKSLEAARNGLAGKDFVETAGQWLDQKGGRFAEGATHVSREALRDYLSNYNALTLNDSEMIKLSDEEFEYAAAGLAKHLVKHSSAEVMDKGEEIKLGGTTIVEWIEKSKGLSPAERSNLQELFKTHEHFLSDKTRAAGKDFSTLFDNRNNFAAQYLEQLKQQIGAGKVSSSDGSVLAGGALERNGLSENQDSAPVNAFWKVMGAVLGAGALGGAFALWRAKQRNERDFAPAAQGPLFHGNLDNAPAAAASEARAAGTDSETAPVTGVVAGVPGAGRAASAGETPNPGEVSSEELERMAEVEKQKIDLVTTKLAEDFEDLDVNADRGIILKFGVRFNKLKDSPEGRQQIANIIEALDLFLESSPRKDSLEGLKRVLVGLNQPISPRGDIITIPLDGSVEEIASLLQRKVVEAKQVRDRLAGDSTDITEPDAEDEPIPDDAEAEKVPQTLDELKAKLRALGQNLKFDPPKNRDGTSMEVGPDEVARLYAVLTRPEVLQNLKGLEVINLGAKGGDYPNVRNQISGRSVGFEKSENIESRLPILIQRAAKIRNGQKLEAGIDEVIEQPDDAGDAGTETEDEPGDEEKDGEDKTVVSAATPRVERKGPEGLKVKLGEVNRGLASENEQVNSVRSLNEKYGPHGAPEFVMPNLNERTRKRLDVIFSQIPDEAWAAMTKAGFRKLTFSTKKHNPDTRTGIFYIEARNEYRPVELLPRIREAFAEVGITLPDIDNNLRSVKGTADTSQGEQSLVEAGAEEAEVDVEAQQEQQRTEIIERIKQKFPNLPKIKHGKFDPVILENFEKALDELSPETVAMFKKSDGIALAYAKPGFEPKARGVNYTFGVDKAIKPDEFVKQVNDLLSKAGRVDVAKESLPRVAKSETVASPEEPLSMDRIEELDLEAQVALDDLNNKIEEAISMAKPLNKDIAISPEIGGKTLEIEERGNEFIVFAPEKLVELKGKQEELAASIAEQKAGGTSQDLMDRLQAQARAIEKLLK